MEQVFFPSFYYLTDQICFHPFFSSEAFPNFFLRKQTDFVSSSFNTPVI